MKGEDPWAGGQSLQGQPRVCPERRASGARYPVRAAMTLGAATNSRGARAARSPSRARNAALAARRSWPGPGLWASRTTFASPLAGPRRHLFAGHLLRVAGTRSHTPGPS